MSLSRFFAFALTLTLAGCSDNPDSPPPDDAVKPAIDAGLPGEDQGSPACAAELTRCGEACVDTSTDPGHCGGCDVACPGTEVCSAGSCRATCQPGLVLCQGRCIAPQSDLTHCGASGDCTGDSAGATCAAGEVCSAGTCALSCQQGLVDCNGRCVDPQSSNAYCGASGDCVGDNAGAKCVAGEICSAGTCALSCQQGLVDCDGKCIDPLTDRVYCGAAGDCAGDDAGEPCAVGEVCSGGDDPTCALSCQAGLVKCGPAGSRLCVDPSTNPVYCGASEDCVDHTADTPPGGDNDGAACFGEEVCQGGKCACLPGRTACGSPPTCVDTERDPSHCGACGNACAAGMVCTGSPPACALSCQQTPVPLTKCDGVCVDLQTDRKHCGLCNRACGAGRVCTNGTCSLTCPPGLKICDGSCVDTSKDPQHCGACNTACAPGQVCSGSPPTCALSCQQTPVPLTTCGGVCVDPQTDRENCGGCKDTPAEGDHVCDAGQVCSGGSCQLTCQAGLVKCGEAGGEVCVDPETNPVYCGASGDCTDHSGEAPPGDDNDGDDCQGDEVCQGGACACLPGLTGCGSPPSCVDVQSDRDNCGGCEDTPSVGDHVCALGEVCSAGSCQLSCQAGLVKCGALGSEVCIDPETSPTYCGASGDCTDHSGETPPGADSDGDACQGDQVCQKGSCACLPGLTACGSPPSCVDTTKDPAHCGGCNNACAAGQVCSGEPAKCTLSCQQTPVPLTNCDGVCVDLKTDRNNCGGCEDTPSLGDNVCALGEVCSAGSCQLSCQTGLVKCGPAGSEVCIDPATSPTYCGASGDCTDHSGEVPPGADNDGAACQGDQTCQGGVCACRAGLTACGTPPSCVDTTKDPLHCGGCSKACGAGEVCSGSGCQLSCQSGLIKCGTPAVCVDPTTSPIYCGASGDCVDHSGETPPGLDNDGATCSGGQVCTADGSAGHECRCTGSKVFCGGSCVDPLTSPSYCGANASCSGGVDCSSSPPTEATGACVAGGCAYFCSLGNADCNGDLSLGGGGDGCETALGSLSNCAFCADVCSRPYTTPSCGAGGCAYSCVSGRGDCSVASDGTGSDSNGCETKLGSESHCAACGDACAAGQACVNGTCKVAGGSTVFVTSVAYVGSSLGGVAGGDAKCQARAVAAGLTGTYKAWLGDALGHNPQSDFVHSPGGYYLVDGTKIADNWTDLTDGSLDAPIDVNELGTTALPATTACPSRPTTVWTGTMWSGASAGANCSNWGDSAGGGSPNALVGRTDSGKAEKDWVYDCYGFTCGGLTAALYCFEQVTVAP